MRLPSSRAAKALVTFSLCAACSWLLLGDHTLAWRLGLSELDLPARVLAMFAALSLVDRLMRSTPK
jgi:hypothetical protein